MLREGLNPYQDLLPGEEEENGGGEGKGGKEKMGVTRERGQPKAAGWGPAKT